LHRYWRNEAKQELLDYLLAQGAADTLLIDATIGDEPRVREILTLDPHQANRVDYCHRRPLSGAVSGGHVAIARLLLAHGADPNAKESICQGGLSLRIAAENGDIELVQLLLDYGAEPNHWVDASGDALYIAYARGHHRVLQLLYAHGGTMELQVYAAYHRIDVIAEVLHLQPSRSDEVLPYGWEDNGNEELAYDIMKLAIRYGARFEQASAWNLKWTVIKYPKVFRLLQQYGANPDLPLLSLAGDMSRRYKDENERLQAIEFLIDQCGANVNCRNEEGFTPLALAAKEGFTDIVGLLLARGADRRSKTPEWAQALNLAEKNGHTAITKLLRYSEGL
jgi:ankyrin repeat protein